MIPLPRERSRIGAIVKYWNTIANMKAITITISGNVRARKFEFAQFNI